MQQDWRSEVQKFRLWAQSQVQVAQWECNYERWWPIYDGVKEFLDQPISSWSQEETEDMLYILARDWECGVIADYMKEYPPEVALYLSEKALEKSEWDARWRLADVLGFLPVTEHIEFLLLRLVEDEEEYVRRRALKSLARLKSPQVEQLALREWERADPNQQWAQMNALVCWRHIGSHLLESYLQQAELSSFEYLPGFVRQLRNGEFKIS